jgi:membrane-associated phospholipid phosphatase
MRLPALGLLLAASLARIAPARAQEPVPPSPAPSPAPSPTPTPAPPLIPGPKPHVRPDDKRRTVRSYAHNLAYDTLAVVQSDNHRPLAITAALTAPAFALDESFQRYFHDHPHQDFGRIGAAMGGTAAVLGGTIGVFSAGRISRGDNFRAASYDVSQAVIVNGFYTFILKTAVRRERPDGSNNLSFPSGHASNAFAIASVMARHYHKLAVPAYAFGTFVAVSRMAAEKHHFSDIVAGSGLGVSIGHVVVRRNGRPPDAKPEPAVSPPPEKTSWELVPWSGPSGDGRGLALVVRF